MDSDIKQTHAICVSPSQSQVIIDVTKQGSRKQRAHVNGLIFRLCFQMESRETPIRLSTRRSRYLLSFVLKNSYVRMYHEPGGAVR